MKRWSWSVVLLALGSPVPADRLVFDTPATWRQWQMPQDLVHIDEGGRLQLVRFRRETNAALDAALFAHPTQKRGEVRGGIWAAGTASATAGLVIDGDLQTFWQPDENAPLENWAVDIDLGRAVLARSLTLRFPDREGVRPFRQFTVYVATGARIQATEDVFKFEPVYHTTQPNQDTLITIPLEYPGTDSTLVLDEGLDLDLDRERRFQVVQYISIEAEEKSAGAALAEVEVLSVGDNVSFGTAGRGAFVNGEVAVAPVNMFDGDMNTYGLVTSGHTFAGTKGGWKESGTWWGVDLGATFFIDGLFLYYQARGEALSSFIFSDTHAGSGHAILYSEGQRSIATSLPVPEALDYTELVTHDRPIDEGLFQIRYLFKPRKMRYLFWHGITDQEWNTRPMELMLFSDGYPAQVVLRSAYLALGQLAGDNRPKVIRALDWEADIPPGSQVQLRSRSGNTLEQVYTFYDKKGEQVSESRWNSLPKVTRGHIDTSVVIGADWDEWSDAYQVSGEAFKSKSPRRFAQVELRLATDDPRVSPRLDALGIDFEEAFLQGARGSILPRQARPNEDTRFTYTLWPQAEEADSGFDLLRLAMPGPAADVAVRVSGKLMAPQMAMHGDSLLLVLPEPIRTDSVEVEFTTRLFHNATVFSLDLGASKRPGVWQSVEAAQRRADVVLVPELASSSRLIGDLQISTQTLTPNGDGVNDQLEISLVVFKVDGQAPKVRLYDLAGRLVNALEATGQGRQNFRWSGRDLQGRLVQPGLYLMHVELEAEAGAQVQTRAIAVAY
ncbi:MAG: hypothetical protein HYW07_15350 [Candidatus Latescibacteria bacterium]|nr:hypothetical protein [Candidatus Latescibacterota bacterium]